MELSESTLDLAKQLKERDQLLVEQLQKIKNLEGAVEALQSKTVHTTKLPIEPMAPVVELKPAFNMDDYEEHMQALANAHEAVESLQRQLKRKDQVLEKYQTMLQNSRDEFAQERKVIILNLIIL